MTRLDPHSVADLDQGRCVGAHLDLAVDFAARTLRGSVELHLHEVGSGPLDLDTRSLQIRSVSAAGSELRWELGPEDAVLGRRLRVFREDPVDTLQITYETSPDAPGLMWLEPEQTDGGAQPFLLSQCQAIHARSLAPLQDTPRARIRYTARIAVPDGMTAVMSAAPGRVDAGALAFEMPQPIPPYLLALAVGQLACRDLGPRTRVWAEPGVVEAAAWEFSDVEQMLSAGEGLFGPYAWERYDFIVLPASFPLGGMENPRMTFLTPTLLAGDRSLVSVLAHELAHSWTGNLVTNANNEHFWLNEGWTVYAERRILEVLYGAEVAREDAVLGRVALEQAMAERRAAGLSNALVYDQSGLDPDAEFSKVPYEKGFLLVSALERDVGRTAFDAFIRAYIERFAFTSITTDDFVAFVREQLPDVGVDLDAWLASDALPADAPTFDAPRLDALRELAGAWAAGARPSPGWGTTATLYYLSQLPTLTAGDCVALAHSLQIDQSANAELQSAWLARASAAGVDDIEGWLRDFLGRVGRTKLIRPVVRGMRASERWRALAQELVEANAPRWHSSTRLALR